MSRKEELVKVLELVPHPEGGFYKEMYRSREQIADLPERFNAKQRDVSTAIYYLLERGNVSKFHRIKSDEIWHYYEGDLLILYIIDQDGLRIEKLGMTESNVKPQIVVPHGAWFAAESTGKHGFTLVGCTVAPGFDFEDFELAVDEQLSELYPEFREIIAKLT